MPRTYKPKPNAMTPSQTGRAGRAASPWNRSPMVDSPRGKLAFINYQKRGKAAREATK